MSEQPAITQAAGPVKARAADELLDQVYGRLRGLARQKLARESEPHTLQPTALVHEAYLKLARQPARRFNGPTHFLAAAAKAMGRILIDQVRRRKALRRGGQFIRVEAAGRELAAPAKNDRAQALEEALHRLGRMDPVKARVVRLRFYDGLSFARTAEALGISEPTAKRYWTFARAWLGRELMRQEEG